MIRMEGFQRFWFFCGFGKRRGELQFAPTSVNLCKDLSGFELNLSCSSFRVQANLLGFSFAKQRNYPIRPRSKRRLVGKPWAHPRKLQRTLAIGGAGAKSAPGGHKNMGLKLRFP